MPRAISDEDEELRRKRISDTLKGHPVSEETRRKIIDAQKGIPKSEEMCRKMSEAHKGKKLSPEHCKNISKGNKGKKLSEEHRQILIKVNTGKKVSDETKAKLRNINIGKHPSQESRDKMSASRMGERHHYFGKHGGEHQCLENIIQMRHVKKFVYQNLAKKTRCLEKTGSKIIIGKAAYRFCRIAINLLRNAKKPSVTFSTISVSVPGNRNICMH